MTLLDDLLADLDTVTDRLRAVVADLDDTGWQTTTPAEGWTVATQVAHLAWTDEAATLAARAHADQEQWDALVTVAMVDPEKFVDDGAVDLAAALAPADLLARWDASRTALQAALRGVPDGVRMPWFGPPMSPTSMVTARFMETWAHSLDVHEALGLTPEHGDEIRHVAHIGVRTRGFSFVTRGLDVPAAEPRVELRAPGGVTWTWGPDGAEESVTGDALDFCRLVTQRVHRADTGLVATGPGADAWLDVAQCFAGPPGPGREQQGAAS
ncbi:TIGR03084 family metal-binding protein [Nocardioides litoris]|uniref:TIGR03084 family metal-binding protein n=1 Tax=Nocardioides litoris TaxID=1926648 RepID=UPI001122D095|nr:TIGR03084 family metal-binding protein [Nocardioides litoris]